MVAPFVLWAWAKIGLLCVATSSSKAFDSRVEPAHRKINTFFANVIHDKGKTSNEALTLMELHKRSDTRAVVFIIVSLEELYMETVVESPIVASIMSEKACILLLGK